MKRPVRVAVMLSLCAWIAVTAVFATSYEERYVASFADRTGMPVPVKVVAPEVPRGTESAEIEVRFIIDETGIPRDLVVIQPAEASLEASLLVAIRQWRFKPLLQDGKAVAATMVLPVRIVRYSDDPLVAMR